MRSQKYIVCRYFLLVSPVICQLLTGCADNAERRQTHRYISAEVDAMFEAFSTDGSPGVAVKVVKDGEVLHQAGYGLADIVIFPDRGFEDLEAAASAVEELAAPEDILIPVFEPDPSLAGKTLAEIATRRGTGAATTLIGLIREAEAMRRERPPEEATTWRASSRKACRRRTSNACWPGPSPASAPTVGSTAPTRGASARSLGSSAASCANGRSWLLANKVTFPDYREDVEMLRGQARARMEV
jgi:hypothetical protein